MARSLLPDRAVVAVTGEDAESLLNRLFTNSMLNMAEEEARYAALLSPQGKLLFDFLVLRRADGFWVDASRNQAAELAKKLNAFKLRAKATITDLSGELSVAAVWDESLPEVTGAAIYRDPRHEALGYRMIGPAAALATTGDDGYRAHRISLGVPEGGTDWPYGDSFVHDANLDLLHGVDFNKGCYVGQEVVSRVHHRGSARKRVVKVHFHGEPPSQAGVELRAGALALGPLTSVAERDGLATVRIDRLQEAIETNYPVTAGETLVEVSVPAHNLLTGTDEDDAPRL